VNDEPKKTESLDLDLESGWDFLEEESVSERPTLAPPFDLASFAKETMAPSSVEAPLAPVAPEEEPVPPPRLSFLPKPEPKVVPNRVISLPPPPPVPKQVASPRAPEVSTRPSLAAAKDGDPYRHATRETAAVGVTGPVTKPPPGGAEELVGLSAVTTPVPPSDPMADEPLSQRITPREMAALDMASLVPSRPDPPSQQAPGTRRLDSVLAMANQRAPLLTPPRLAAVAPPPAAPPVETAAAVTDPVTEMQERFALGDYSGALVMAESMLDENPTHVEAREYAESCRSVLQQMYTARIGPLDRVPVVEIARDQLRWLSIDHRTGFILSLVDGISSLEMILDVSGMPPLDALRMLFELVQQRIISIRED
jgi:hypothetical protein